MQFLRYSKFLFQTVSKKLGLGSILKKENWHFCSTKNNPTGILPERKETLHKKSLENLLGRVQMFFSKEVNVHKNCTEEPSLQEFITFCNLICSNKKKVGLDNIIKIEKSSCLQKS